MVFYGPWKLMVMLGTLTTYKMHGMSIRKWVLTLSLPLRFVFHTSTYVIQGSERVYQSTACQRQFSTIVTVAFSKAIPSHRPKNNCLRIFCELTCPCDPF